MSLPMMPEPGKLVQAIEDALDEVAASYGFGPYPVGNWTNQICEGIKGRVAAPGVECAFGRDRKKDQDQREWLFDFCALFFEETSRAVPRFMAQALIIGEVEGNTDVLDDDFEKLLVVDSLVCFFVFPCWTDDDATEKLDKFQKLAERRQRYARGRGMNRPPIFVLSCYRDNLTPKKFIHSIVDSAPTESGQPTPLPPTLPG
jgi:hypothetical protein